MAQQVKVFATKPEDLSTVLRPHMVEGENQTRFTSTLEHAHVHTHTHTCAHK